MLILSLTSSTDTCGAALVILAIALFSRSWFSLFRIIPQTASWYERRLSRARLHTSQLDRPNRSVSLILAESALEGSHIRFQVAHVRQVMPSIQASGTLRVDELGLSIQAFPMDSTLSTLTTSCDTAPQSLLFQALEKAAQQQLGDPAWYLVAASAEPVRYKPASRCVIRYYLTLERQQEGIPLQKTLAIYGKVYADVEQARNVQATMQAIYEEQVNLGQQFPASAELFVHVYSFMSIDRPCSNVASIFRHWMTVSHAQNSTKQHCFSKLRLGESIDSIVHDPKNSPQY